MWLLVGAACRRGCLRSRIARYHFSWRKSLLISVTAFATAWGVAWLFQSRIHGVDGIPVRILGVSCARTDSSIRYTLMLPRGTGKLWRELKIDRFKVNSGWQRMNGPLVTSIRMDADDRSGTPARYAHEGFFDVADIAAIFDDAQTTELTIIEEYATPPSGYVGWQAREVVSDRGGSACGSAIEAFVELRGFEKGVDAPRLYMY
jgi:hypothetical protein